MSNSKRLAIVVSAAWIVLAYADIHFKGGDLGWRRVQLGDFLFEGVLPVALVWGIWLRKLE